MTDIGIIGFGNIGKRHYKALESLNSVSQVHIYSSKEHPFLSKATFYDNIASVVAASKGIVIAAPNHVHAYHILSLVKEGRFVLCEKPLCSSVAELNELQFIDDNLLVSMVFNYRFLNVTQAAKDFIAKHSLQNINKVKISFHKDTAFRKEVLTWRDSGMAGNSSGAFGDLGIHLIDLMIYLCQAHPKAPTILLTQTRVPKIGGQSVLVDDDASFSGQLENGIQFEILTTKTCQPDEKGFGLIVEAKASEFSYHSGKPSSFFIKEGEQHQSFPLAPRGNEDPDHEVYGWADSFVSLHKAWLNKLGHEKNHPLLSTLQDGIIAQNILFKAFDGGYHDYSPN